jgi:hypothetical protein
MMMMRRFSFASLAFLSTAKPPVWLAMQTAWSLPAVGALRLKCKTTGNGQGDGEGGMKCSKTPAMVREIRGCLQGLHQELRLRAPLRRVALRQGAVLGLLRLHGVHEAILNNLEGVGRQAPRTAPVLCASAHLLLINVAIVK